MPDKRKILVVDDSTDAREILHFYLTDEGFTVVIAATAGEGLYMAQAEKPDLIITDLGLPDMHGSQLIKELRSLDGFADVPIIALTAFGGSKMDEAIEAGANRAVTKPTDLEALVDDVEALLKIDE